LNPFSISRSEHYLSIGQSASLCGKQSEFGWSAGLQKNDDQCTTQTALRCIS